MVKTLASSAGDVGLIPGQETKIPDAVWPKKKIDEEVLLDVSLFFTSYLQAFRL